MNQSSDYEYGADHVAPNDYLGGEKPDLNNIFIVQGDSSSVRVSTFLLLSGDNGGKPYFLMKNSGWIFLF